MKITHTLSDSVASQQYEKPFNISIIGNIIPNDWYSRFTNKKGTPDLSVISVLSEIVYWYRPKKLKNPNTNQISYVSKFLGDAWQTSYEHFQHKFAFNREKVRRVFVKLEEMGIVAREFRTVTLKGQSYSNRLFIHLSSDFLKSYTGDSSNNNLVEKSNTSFFNTKIEACYPQIEGQHICIDKNKKKRSIKDRSMNSGSIEPESQSNFKKNSLLEMKEKNADITNGLEISETKMINEAELKSQEERAVKPIIANKQFSRKRKKLIEFHPLNEKDYEELQASSEREFSLNSMNEILKSMSSLQAR